MIINICKYLILIVQFVGIYSYAQTKNYTDYVNPFIGTGGAGHTFPGAVLPFGMVQLSPDTRVDNSWEGCSGYHYSDSIIYGFSHTHLSGTGVSDYGDILIMPFLNENNANANNYATKFFHSNEKASAGFYEVKLENDIDVKLTATQRVGIHQYTYPKGNTAHIFIDLLHRDKTLSSSFTLLDSVTAVGSRISEGWAAEQHVYFIMKFSKPVTNKILNTNIEDNKLNKVSSAVLEFSISDDKPLIIKVGISQTNIDGAKNNLQAEAKDWNFENYHLSAIAAWQKALSTIQIQTPDTEKYITFYTALYHCMIHPSLAGDVDGKYRGRDHKIYQANGFTPYTVFSLWDTFRALNPLFTIIEQKRTADFINSFLNQYKQSKRLPMWELSGNETNCMIGFHSVSVIADAMNKNLNGFDKNLAYEAMLAASNYTNFGIPVFNKNNYLQIDDESESVSKTLEYAYDNWCIAQVAQKLNKKNDFKVLMDRAQAYKNLYDNKTGFMRPRKNGNWLTPFEPREVNNHFTEANSWQYSFFAPQDINGLIKIMGGKINFEKKLDDLFEANTQTVGRTQSDITGLIGQYAHGNEPSHHISYLYNYVGKPQKTQEKVYKILTEFYNNTPNGLIGNEDCGQMSAWYVLSSMGFYQVCPAKPEYAIGTPLFDNVKIKLENGKTFEISKKQTRVKFQYIKASILNGKENNNSFITHQIIQNGGKLEFIMEDGFNSKSQFGKNPSQIPKTEIITNQILQTPIIISPFNFADTSKIISLYHPNSNAKLYYTLNGTEPTKKSFLYSKPFLFDSSITIKGKAYLDNDSSTNVTAHVFKKSNNWKILISGAYNKQYDAGGDAGIIDGQHATINWRSGGWQGYQNQNFEAVINLGKNIPINSINSSYLQDTRSWIIFPLSVEYFASEDGINYALIGKVENGVAADDYSLQIQKFSLTNLEIKKAQYIKVKATNFGKLPNWHQGKDGDAFIFIDEIEIK